MSKEDPLKLPLWARSKINGLEARAARLEREHADFVAKQQRQMHTWDIPVGFNRAVTVRVPSQMSPREWDIMMTVLGFWRLGIVDETLSGDDCEEKR